MFDTGAELDKVCSYCNMTGGQEEETLSDQESDRLQIYKLGKSEEHPCISEYFISKNLQPSSMIKTGFVCYLRTSILRIKEFMCSIDRRMMF